MKGVLRMAQELLVVKTATNDLPSYRVMGRIGWLVDGGSDPDYLNVKTLDETFSAPDDESAIETAKRMIEEFRSEYPGIRHDSKKSEYDDFIQEFSLVRVVWGTQYVKGKPEKPAIPFEPEVPNYVVETFA